MFRPRTFLAPTRRLRRFGGDTEGSTLSIEFLLILPIMIWAYFGSMVFFDAFRANTQAQVASLHVADLMSRQTDSVTTVYLEGLNDVFDFLTTRDLQTRLRISVFVWDFVAERPAVAWSYGTRGLLPLSEVFEDMAEVGETSGGAIGTFVPPGLANGFPGNGNGNGNGPPAHVLERIAARLANQVGTQFTNPSYHLPDPTIWQQVQALIPGESLIMVESFSVWETPAESLVWMPFLRDTRLAKVAVTRPRFSPFINYEGAGIDVPPGGTEMPPGWVPPPPVEEPEPEPVPPPVATIVNTDFSTGAPPGWSHTNVTHTNVAGVGSFLGPFGQATLTNPVTYAVNLGAASTRATIEFDLFIIDSWDGYNLQWARPEGEHLMIQVNGTTIAVEAFHLDPWAFYLGRRQSVASRAEGHFTTTMERIQSGTNLWGDGWGDQRWRVTIDIESPAQTFSLGFRANLNEDLANESFGLSSFRVTAERGTPANSHFVPAAANLLGTDPNTFYPVFSGCPDHRQAAQTHNLRNDDLSSPLRHRVRAGGPQTLRNCSGFGSSPYTGRIRATPSLVLDWNNQGYNQWGRYLRIRTDDGNNGNTCDTTILIRDPSGAWHFNDDFSGYNAGRNMGAAMSGTYQIWVGTFGSSLCNSDIVLERY